MNEISQKCRIAAMKYLKGAVYIRLAEGDLQPVIEVTHAHTAERVVMVSFEDADVADRTVVRAERGIRLAVVAESGMARKIQ